MATRILVFQSPRARAFDFTTKAAFKKHFTKQWATECMGLTNKQYDPHGTKKPVAFDALIDEGIQSKWLPPKAVKWKNYK